MREFLDAPCIKELRRSSCAAWLQEVFFSCGVASNDPGIILPGHRHAADAVVGEACVLHRHTRQAPRGRLVAESRPHVERHEQSEWSARD